jgi:hypothetical protein
VTLIRAIACPTKLNRTSEKILFVVIRPELVAFLYALVSRSDFKSRRPVKR